MGETKKWNLTKRDTPLEKKKKYSDGDPMLGDDSVLSGGAGVLFDICQTSNSLFGRQALKIIKFRQLNFFFDNVILSFVI